MAPRPNKSWQSLRGEKPLNEKRVAAYSRLVEAQERIAQARLRRGVSEATIAAAVAAGESSAPELEQHDDLVHLSLARYVAALGGELNTKLAGASSSSQLVAIFPEEAIPLP